MYFALTSEQRELAQAVRQLLAKEAPLSKVRQMIEPQIPRDDGVWTKMAGELGLLGLVVPEQYGGAGASSIELAAVLEETGRALLIAPFFATTALATQVLLECGDEQVQEQYLPQIASGELTGTAVVSVQPSDIIASDDRIGSRLSGTARFVISGADVDVIFTDAADQHGARSIYAVDMSASGVDAERLRSADLTRPLAHVVFNDAPAMRVGAAGDGPRICAVVADRAAIYLACEQVGGAKACLEMAVAYAKTRRQFNRPIGSFQAIKHMLADVLLESESAWAAAFYAAAAIATPSEDIALVASIAKSSCAEAFFLAAGTSIQVHGGIGFTWEQDCHLYFKRANAGRQLLGSTQAHRERIATAMSA